MGENIFKWLWKYEYFRQNINFQKFFFILLKIVDEIKLWNIYKIFFKHLKYFKNIFLQYFKCMKVFSMYKFWNNILNIFKISSLLADIQRSTN